MEDLSECFANIFFEADEYVLKFDISAFYTAKNNQALIVNNFVYHLKTNNEKTDSQRWVCRSCSASISTVKEEIVKINGKKVVFDKELASYHKHPAISKEEVSQILSFERIKQKVAANSNVPIQKIFEHKEIQMAKAGKSTKEIADGMFQYESKKSSLYRKKWSNHPKLPTELKDLLIDTDVYKNTLSGNRFLSIDCVEDDQRIIIFCSDVQLKVLGSCSKIGADGIFDTCPALFEQFYIIMAWYKGVVLPSAFILLGGKKGRTYMRMIDELKKAVLEINMEFRPNFILIDFEYQAIQAFIFYFPFATILGCWF